MAASQATGTPSPTASPGASPDRNVSRRRSPSDGRSPAPPRLRPRRPTQERIDQILETALERAESTAPRKMEPLLGGQSPRGGTIAEHGESSADEGPDVPRRTQEARGVGHHVSYLSTATTARSSSSLATAAEPATRRKSSQVRAQQDGGDGPAAADGPEAEDEKWWNKVLSSFTSIELENKGSVARDHLALERTFLAWLRTSLAFASIGVAITQLFRLNTALSGEDGKDGKEGGASDGGNLTTLRRVGKPLGATFLALSILVLFLGYNRYNASQRWILRGKFPASRGTIILVSTATFSLMIVSLVVVVVIPGTPNGS